MALPGWDRHHYRCSGLECLQRLVMGWCRFNHTLEQHVDGYLQHREYLCRQHAYVRWYSEVVRQRSGRCQPNSRPDEYDCTNGCTDQDVYTRANQDQYTHTDDWPKQHASTTNQDEHAW